jgi:pimeloyl-ACP methyl ester carboxylesterase
MRARPMTKKPVIAAGPITVPPPPPPVPADPNELLRRHLSEAVHRAALSDDEPDLPMPSSARKRARTDPRAGSRLATVSLVQDDGILRWVYDPPPGSSRRRARRAAIGVDEEDVIHGFQFLEVPANQVIQKLEDLDDSLTPNRGLRQWINGQPGPVSKAAKTGKVLLLVHGTFSKGDMYFEEFAAAQNGQAFLASCAANYDAILTFDHPTLSMSPWINAIDLAGATADFKGPIDVVCHSRGGLVVSWWLFHAHPNVERVVFVGSPLEGTSLAAPAKLKQALDLLGNFARALGAAGNAAASAVPMLGLAGGLMKIFGGVLSLGAGSPLIDAGVVLVPGLASQSRVRNNFELGRLFSEDWGSRYELHAILSNYEPKTSPEPWWKFWSHFRDLPGKLADFGADVIFSGPNDLVVDTASMTLLGGGSIPKARQLRFKGDEAVHHCAYFRQSKTLDFLSAVLTA